MEDSKHYEIDSLGFLNINRGRGSFVDLSKPGNIHILGHFSQEEINDIMEIAEDYWTTKNPKRSLYLVDNKGNQEGFIGENGAYIGSITIHGHKNLLKIKELAKDKTRQKDLYDILTECLKVCSVSKEIPVIKNNFFSKTGSLLLHAIGGYGNQDEEVCEKNLFYYLEGKPEINNLQEKNKVDINLLNLNGEIKLIKLKD